MMMNTVVMKIKAAITIFKDGTKTIGEGMIMINAVMIVIEMIK